MTIFIGVDSGIKGALAFLDGAHTVVEDMPVRDVVGATKARQEIDPVRLKDIMRKHVKADQSALVLFEDLNVFVGGGPNSPIKKSPITSAYQEANKQVVRAVIELCGLPLEKVRPVKWQTFFGIAKNEHEDTKKQSLRIARGMFGKQFCPLEKHDGRADALLIAHYGRRFYS